MAFAFADVLAGPIVRRVEPALASVWIALSQPANVELRLYEGLKDGSSPGTEIAKASMDTVRVGKNLHLAVPAVRLPEDADGQQLTLRSDQVYSYDVRLRAPGTETGDGAGLAALGLLADATVDGHKHLALGYQQGQLPGFALPPTDIGNLNLLTGSCRLPHNAGADAMPAMDDLLSKDNAYLDAAKRPHQLFLTGDQIYADELAPVYLSLANPVGNRLLAGDARIVERLPLRITTANGDTTHQIPASTEHYPPTRRQRMIVRQAGLTSGYGGSHVLSFGEFCALYLLGWSNRLWPADWDSTALSNRWQQVQTFRAAWESLYDNYQSNKDALTAKQRKVADKKLQHFHAAKLLPPEWRRVDIYLSDTDRRDDWGREDVGSFSTIQGPPNTNSDAGGPLPDLPTDVGRELAKALTPSWYAGHREMGFKFEGKTLFQDTILKEIRALQNYYKGLPKVRRLLANVPTYMTFDDHEVTDDWNISGQWVAQVNEKPLGRAVLRNALLSFGLFQAWGNDPLYFRPPTGRTPGSDMLDNAADLFFNNAGEVPDAMPDPDGTPVQRLERLFNIAQNPPTPFSQRVRWHYRIGGHGYEVLSLDTRTMRGFPTPTSPAELLTLEALQDQIPIDPVYSYGPPPPGTGITLVIAAAPVLGFPPVEYVVQPVVNTLDRLKLSPTGPLAAAEVDYFAGAYTHDPEPWAYQEHIFEALLERLAPYGRVAFLSGDVHYATCLKLDYWRYDPSQPAQPPTHSRFVQLTASALKNQTDRTKIMLFQSGFVSKLAQRLGIPRVRLGYNTEGKPEPLVAPAGQPFNRLIERQNHSDPALIPFGALPEGTRQRYNPDWVWRLDLMRDERADDDRLTGVVDVPPMPEPDVTGTALGVDVATRHFWQTMHVPSRIVTFFPNACQIRVKVEADAPSAILFGIHQDLRALDGSKVKDYTRYSLALDAEGQTPPVLPPV